MKSGKLIVTIVIILLASIFLWQYVFTAYEVKAEVQRGKKSGSEEKAEVYVYPVNALGLKIPFRQIAAKFDVIQGDSLIKIDSTNQSRDKLVFYIGNKPGTIIVKIITDLSLFPIIEEIKVLPE